MDILVSSPGATLRAEMKQRCLTTAWFAMGSVPLVEIGAAQGFDLVVIDLQHGLWDRMSAHLAVSALGTTPVMMRVARNSVAAIGEALDSGAQGVLIPLVETAEQAMAAVSAATFPMNGVRSGGGVRALGQGFARYHKQNAHPLIGVMIETATGVGNAAAIAAVPGIDFVFIGTGDLALSLDCFPDIDARHEEACVAIFDACRAVAMPCGIFTGSAEAAHSRRAEGYAVVVAANDIDVISGGFAQASRVLAK